jgi:hypothetical protein
MEKKMKKLDPNDLRELLWRTSLNQEEEAQLQAYLSAHPEADLREELRLNQVLNQLPDAPIASNFTSQVLRAIELEEIKISREHKRGWPAWRVGFGWVSRLVIAGFVFVAGVLTIHQVQTTKRAELAQSVEKVSHVASLPTDWLENFDTINRLNLPAPADEELLAALK